MVKGFERPVNTMCSRYFTTTNPLEARVAKITAYNQASGYCVRAVLTAFSTRSGGEVIIISSLAFTNSRSRIQS